MTHKELEAIKYRYRMVKDKKWETVRVRTEEEFDCQPIYRRHLFIDGEDLADLGLLLDSETAFIGHAVKDIEALLYYIGILEAKVKQYGVISL